MTYRSWFVRLVVTALAVVGLSALGREGWKTWKKHKEAKIEAQAPVAPPLPKGFFAKAVSDAAKTTSPEKGKSSVSQAAGGKSSAPKVTY